MHCLIDVYFILKHANGFGPQLIYNLFSHILPCLIDLYFILKHANGFRPQLIDNLFSHILPYSIYSLCFIFLTSYNNTWSTRLPFLTCIFGCFGISCRFPIYLNDRYLSLLCECLDKFPTSVASAACEDDPSHRRRPYVTVKTLVGRISGCCKGVAVRDTGQTINHPHPSSCGYHPPNCVHILKLIKKLMKTRVDGLVLDCINSIANCSNSIACTKPSMYVSLSASHVKTWTTTRPTHICVSINSLRTKFFRGNTDIYLHFMSLPPIDMTRVLKIFLRVRPGPTYST